MHADNFFSLNNYQAIPFLKKRSLYSTAAVHTTKFQANKYLCRINLFVLLCVRSLSYLHVREVASKKHL